MGQALLHRRDAHQHRLQDSALHRYQACEPVNVCELSVKICDYNTLLYTGTKPSLKEAADFAGLATPVIGGMARPDELEVRRFITRVAPLCQTRLVIEEGLKPWGQGKSFGGLPCRSFCDLSVVCL